MKADLRDLAQGFALLSDRTRLGILRILAKGPVNVTAFCRALKLKQPTVSHHLGLLRMGRLVKGTRQGKSVVYATDKAALGVLSAVLAKLMPR
jgi:ArsR family transcriptional regulator